MNASAQFTSPALFGASDVWSRWLYMVDTGEGSFVLDEWNELAAIAAKLAPSDVPYILDGMALDYPPGSTGVFDDDPWGADAGDDEPTVAEIMALEERMGWAHR